MLAVQTAAVGPWIVAVPLAACAATLSTDTPQWTGPDGHLLLLHDDQAQPALDLGVCWKAQAMPSARTAALLLHPPTGEPSFALRVDAVGPARELAFWPVPTAVQSACGVQAVAWQGAPWQPAAGQAVLLIDLPWVTQSLQTASEGSAGPNQVSLTPTWDGPQDRPPVRLRGTRP